MKFRPIRVSILGLFFLAASAWNAVRMGEAIHFWRTSIKYGLSPLYIALSGGIWFLLGLFLFWGNWWGKYWARITTVIAVLSYSIWYWIDRLVLQQPHANWSFLLVVNAVFLGLIGLIVFSRKTKLYFKRDVNEQ